MLRLCCISASYRDLFQQGKIDLLGFLEVARKLKLDGVDIHVRDFASSDREYLKQVKERCLYYGLSIACVSIGGGFANATTGKNPEIDKANRWIDVAQFLGAPVARVFSGAASAEEKKEGKEEIAWARAVECLREVARYGQEAGVKVALQNHNHGTLTKTGEDIIRMINEVGPNLLGHVLDTGQYAGSPGSSGNTKENESLFDFHHSIELTVKLAVHVRTKLYLGGSRATGRKDADLNYDRIFNILKQANYNGFISLVAEGLEAEESAIPRGISYLLEYIQQARSEEAHAIREMYLKPDELYSDK